MGALGVGLLHLVGLGCEKFCLMGVVKGCLLNGIGFIVEDCYRCLKWADALQACSGFWDNWDEGFARRSESNLHRDGCSASFGFSLELHLAQIEDLTIGFCCGLGCLGRR